MSSITPQQMIRWQNELINYRDKNGTPYSPVYLKTLHNQLSAIFNHAVRYYNLKENPCVKAGSMGKKKNREILFWTKDEYLNSLSFRRLLLPPTSRTARLPITYTPVYPPPKDGQSIDPGTADEEISLSNKVQNHIDAQISNDSVYRFIKPRILGLPECSAP